MPDFDGSSVIGDSPGSVAARQLTMTDGELLDDYISRARAFIVTDDSIQRK